jgi:hypothetical protein
MLTQTGRVATKHILWVLTHAISEAMLASLMILNDVLHSHVCTPLGPNLLFQLLPLSPVCVMGKDMVCVVAHVQIVQSKNDTKTWGVISGGR